MLFSPLFTPVAGMAGLVAAPIIAPAVAGEVVRFHDEHVLGTRFGLVAVADDRAAAERAAIAARQEIDRLEAVFNSRRAGAELADLNASSGGRVSEALFQLLERAEAWRRRTEGAFDARIGAALDLWRTSETTPDRAALAAALAERELRLDAGARSVAKARTTTLALDGFAKGHIVDCALAAARSAGPGVRGLALDIGGDLACWGVSPDGGRWRVGIGDPMAPEFDAPPAAYASLAGGAVATSGRGPRDRFVGGVRYSPTLSPATGWPVAHTLSATVVAPCAADADALATAFMVMPHDRAMKLADDLPGVALRLTPSGGAPLLSSRWRDVAEDVRPPMIRIAATPKPAARPAAHWPPDWGLELLYVAPDKKEANDPDFRSPYMVLWISDARNNPIRTITMVGREVKYHRDNFIWFGSYRGTADRIVNLRSEATALSGRYSLFWRGVDDAYQPLPQGDYILHIETSQEHGKHTHRMLPLKIGSQPFTALVPPTIEGGGLQISYGLKR